MAADAPPAEEYTLLNDKGETLKASRGYNGTGTASYPNGDKYTGDFVNGVREGKGKYVYATQDEYEGEFKANLKHGIGKMSYKAKGENHGEYYGYWENDQKSGEGVFTYPGGDIYSGAWKNGKRDGKGTYIFAGTGIKYFGMWSDGNFVQGKWLFPNGTYFEGAYEGNQPKGRGQWVFKNKDVVAGDYSQTIEQESVDAPKAIKLGWKTASDIVEDDAAKRVEA